MVYIIVYSYYSDVIIHSFWDGKKCGNTLPAIRVSYGYYIQQVVAVV